MPAHRSAPAPLAPAGAAVAKLPAKTRPVTSGATEVERYRFAKWRAPGR